jgi:hypothetical protein
LEGAALAELARTEEIINMEKYISDNGILYSGGALPMIKRRGRGRPRIKRPPQTSRVYQRKVKCRELLASFCLDRGVSLEDIKGPELSREALEARRDFIILAAAVRPKLGCIVVANALNVTHWTVQYWRNPEMRERKMRQAELRRANREAGVPNG